MTTDHSMTRGSFTPNDKRRVHARPPAQSRESQRAATRKIQPLPHGRGSAPGSFRAYAGAARPNPGNRPGQEPIQGRASKNSRSVALPTAGLPAGSRPAVGIAPLEWAGPLLLGLADRKLQYFAEGIDRERGGGRLFQRSAAGLECNRQSSGAVHFDLSPIQAAGQALDVRAAQA